MLVLTRKVGEKLVIGNSIRISVVSIGPGRVKLGIEAPADVTIDREEIHERKQFEDTGVTATVTAAPALHNRIADQLPQTVIDLPMGKSNFRTKPR